MRRKRAKNEKFEIRGSTGPESGSENGNYGAQNNLEGGLTHVDVETQDQRTGHENPELIPDLPSSGSDYVKEQLSYC